MQKKITFFLSCGMFLFLEALTFFSAEAIYPLFFNGKSVTGMRIFILDALLVPLLLLLLALVISNCFYKRLNGRTIALFALSVLSAACGRGAYNFLDFTVAPYVFSVLEMLFVPFAFASAFTDLFGARGAENKMIQTIKRIIFAVFLVLLSISCAAIIFCGSAALRSAYLILICPVFLPLCALPQFFYIDRRGFCFSFLCGLTVALSMLLRVISVRTFGIFIWLLPSLSAAALANWTVGFYKSRKKGKSGSSDMAKQG